MRLTLVFATLVCSAPVLEAQVTARVQGRVIHEASGTPVRGARITVLATGAGVVAAPDGSFRLTLGPGTHELTVSAMGFVPRRLLVHGDSALGDVRLQSTALSLSAVTVTATPGGAGIGGVAAPVSVLGARDVERNLGATIASTLAREPGITLRSQGPAAAMPIIRGLTGDRIVVLQDGQRTGDLAASAPDHGVTIDPLAAREIEVVRGPAALLYGSNALGGVINVISDDIPRLVPAQRLTTLSLSGETVTAGGGTLLDITQPLGERLAFSLKAGGRSHGNQGLGGVQDGELLNTSARNRSLVAGAGYVGARQSGGVAYRRYAFEYGLPLAGDPADGVRLRGGRHEASARWQAELSGPVQRVRAEGTAQWYDHDEVLTSGEVATNLGLRTSQLQVIASARPRGWLANGALGMTVLQRANGVRGDAALTPPNDSRALGVVLFQELAPGAGRGVRVPVAVRLERTDISSRPTTAFGPVVHREFSALSASTGLVVPAGGAATLAVNLARAVRAPGAEELFSRAGHAGTGAFEVGNPGLAPEVTHGLDVVWRVDRPRLRLQAAGFHTRVDGWIGMYPTGRDTTVVSGGREKSLPLRMVSQVPAELSGAELLVERALGALVLGAMADVVYARDAAGAALPYMPPGRVGTTVRWDNGRWEVGSSLRYAFAQRDVVPGETTTGGFLLADVSAGVRFGLGQALHTVLVRLDNATDRWSRDATSRAREFAPNPGRSLALTWRVSR